MSRVKYNISVKADKKGVAIKQIEGYTIRIGNFRFGISNRNTNGEVISKYWKVTELSTGYYVAEGNSKKEAIAAVYNKDFITKLSAAMEKLGEHEDINPNVPITTRYYMPV